MKIKLIRFLSLILLFLACGTLIFAEGNKKDKSLSKVTGQPSYTHMNINQISTFFYNNGASDISALGSSGLIYPKGSGKAASFQSGFLWGGKVDGEFRTGGSAYRQSTIPGRIIGSGASAVAEDPNADDVRIYRVRRDYKTGNLQDELNDGDGSSIDAIRAQYELDWNQWPANQGAPYEDVDGNGMYDPAVDIPGVVGSDQTVWSVCNDFDEAQNKYFYGSPSMGVEEQITAWGYKATGALGNMIFRKYTLINKNKLSKPFTEMYVSMWSDVDLGFAGDDFAGCDTLLSLGYVYNETNSDNTYEPLPPPALGFDYFQGPRIQTNNPADTAIFGNKKWAGYKNLPMTSFYFFINPDPVYADPTQGNYNTGTLQWLNLFTGRVSTTGQPYTDPVSGKTTMFPLSGDPVTQTGWVDGLLHPAGDRRIGMVSGPFTMAYGDTQEVVVAEIVAGAIPGVDRIQAISMLKEYDVAAQIAYDRFFNLPRAPQQPSVVGTGLDQEIVLNWGSDIATVNKTEGYSDFGYAFEGYNVYQLPYASAGIDQAKLLVTYDVVNGVKKIIDKTFDPAAGVAIDKVTGFGNDSGIKRYIKITVDATKGNTPLLNGSKYYFAVTAYAYNEAPLFGPKVLENAIATFDVVPQQPNPGVRYPAEVETRYDFTKTAGVSDGLAWAILVDPSKVNGATYKYTFKDDGTGAGTVLWTLTRNGVVVQKDQANFAGGDDYITLDGLLLKVTGPPVGLKSLDMYSSDDETTWGWKVVGDRKFTPAGADDAGYGPGYGSNFGVNMGYAFDALCYTSPDFIFNGNNMVVKPGELKNVVLKLAKVDYEGDWGPTLDPNDVNVSYSYRYLRRANAAASEPRFAPFIKNPVGGLYPFQEFSKNMPMSAWNIEVPATPKRLALGFLENNVVGGLVDGVYWPGSNANIASNTSSGGPREWLFIMDEPYTETPNAIYQEPIANQQARVMYTAFWNRRSGHLSWTANTGTDQFFIYANHGITPTDVFELTAPAVVNDPNLAKEDVGKINVFPNPYYGVNPQELNKYQRFVTFSHLPQKATLRIFNLAGQSVRTLYKDSPDQFFRWDLNNESSLPVASGLYLVYIDMPDLGSTKIVKVAVIQEQVIWDRF